VRILVTADLHFGTDYPYSKKGEDGVSTRLMDIFNIFKKDIFGKYLNDWDILVIAGDVFDKSKLDGETLSIVARLIGIIEGYDKPAIIIAGNHDKGSKVSTLLQYKNLRGALNYCYFATEFGTYTIDNIMFYLVPWTAISEIRNNLERIISKLSTGTNVIIGHFAVKGTEYYGSTCKEGLVKEELGKLRKTGVDWIILGHHHKPQQILSHTFYAGSPFQKDFGEINEDHGFWIIDTEKEKKKFYKSNAPTFLDIPYEDYKNHNFSNEIVRVTFTGDIVNDPSKMGKIKEAIKLKGAVHVVSRIERPKQIKAMKLSSSLSPEKMVALYVQRNASKELVERVGKKDLLSFGLKALQEARSHGNED